MSEKKDILKKALNSINLIDYVFKKGYTQEKKGKSSPNFKSLINPDTGDNIVVKRKTNTFFNADPNLLTLDNGNVVNFLLNRVNGGFPVSNRKPTKEQYREVFKILEKDLYEESLVNINNIDKPNFQNVKKEYDNSDDAKKKIKNLQDPSQFSYNYLQNHRNINPDIIHHPIFAGKFKESPVIMNNGKVICNLAVVKTDLNNMPTGIVTHFFSAKDKQCKKNVYDIKENIWKSNPLGDVKNLIYGEATMDILAHFELFSPKDCMYVSLEGNISNGKLENLFELYNNLSQKKSVKLVSVTDNDYSGYSYDIKTAVFFHNKLNPNNPIELIQEQNYIKYVLHGHLKNEVDFKELKENMLQYLRLEAPNNHNLFSPYLNLIQTKDFTIFEVPYKNQNDKVCLFLKPLIEVLFKNNNIEFVPHKAKCKDWNEDLVQKKNTKKNSLEYQKENDKIKKAYEDLGIFDLVKNDIDFLGYIDKKTLAKAYGYYMDGDDDYFLQQDDYWIQNLEGWNFESHHGKEVFIPTSLIKNLEIKSEKAYYSKDPLKKRIF